MKYIHKTGSPHAYSLWCAAVVGTGKSDWREVPVAEKAWLLAALIKEQGSLCAYTMRRIDSDSAHVEHIKPQSQCRADQPGSDLDYTNLVACFPREGMSVRFRYGAQKKGDWWLDNGAEFVSPLHPSCEKRFQFHLDGSITAVRNYGGARTTIKVLGLDHPSLTDDRKRVIEEFIYGPNGDAPLSQGETKRAQTTICDQARSNNFNEFCIAIRDTLDEHLRTLRKRRQRNIAIRKKH